ncbi:MAG TPA: YciI family protein [Nitriliruptorales bacterium]|nr:YciI family protein [Nitriliruptorales bacterium]
MRYAALIYAEEAEPVVDVSPEEAMRPWFEFGEKNERYLRGGEALQPTATATCVRVRDGEVLTTDGPYAETKEALGGFYLVEADDLDQAIDVARQIPAAFWGTIELRPIMEIPDQP